MFSRPGPGVLFPEAKGTLFSGGEGSFVRAAAGALLLMVLVNLIVLNGLPIAWQFVAKGLVLVAAVAIQTAGRRGAGG